MNFRIADTFTDSLVRLTGEEQKLVKTTAFDLQLNPANPGMSFHKLDRAKDKNFWSVRAGRDIRIIVHKTQSDLLLCYVDHHDKAYAWAERRKLETHPKTGAAQLVEIRERVVEIRTARHVEVCGTEPTSTALFAHRSDEELLGYGVPPEWVYDVRRADEDRLLELADHLPAEAAEALLELATGGEPQVVPPKPATSDPFAHPDAQRRFRIMTDVEELARALDAPWDKWTVFLHPAQRQWVERDFNGPARVSGPAGTGKTIVALHRAVHLARRHPESRVLLTTFSDALANALAARLRRLVGNEPRIAEHIEVGSLDAVGARLYERRFGRFVRATPQAVRSAIAKAAKAHPEAKATPAFLLSEWNDLVDAWQLDSWEAYRDVKRLGRKTRLSEARRAALWSVFDAVRRALAQQELVTAAAMFGRLAADVAAHGNAPFDFVVVDESQDLTPAQLRFLAAVAARQPNGLFFAGDLGQRIFQQPFSWRALGVDIRGRSRTLNVNYRTSHQIRSQADRLLGVEVSDVDGNTETRKGTVSVFNGPQPSVERHETEAEEIAAVAAWIAARRREGLAAEEIGVFVRSDAELPRAQAAVSAAGAKYTVLDERAEAERERVAVSTMHLAKGLEFRAVVVMACDDEICPLQSRIESVSDEADLEEVYATERQLLYVACTRAREHLLVTGVAPGSEFLADLRTAAVPA